MMDLRAHFRSHLQTEYEKTREELQAVRKVVVNAENFTPDENNRREQDEIIRSLRDWEGRL
jgi:hypothetical protein